MADIVAQARTGVIRIEIHSCDGSTGVGTGLLIGSRLVATVEHVVQDANEITLKGGGNVLGPATIIGADQARDLALIQLAKPTKGYVFHFAKRAPRLGENVVALGFPLGLPLTLTRGAVSGLNRTVKIGGVSRRKLIQTDAAVNRGNSGGPLLSERGEVLGLLDLKLLAASGIAYAVSAQVAQPLTAAWHVAPQPVPLDRCSAPTPPVPPPPSGSPGVDYDFVAYSGGEGVRYRYSPRLNDLVPGNGPFEGDRVTIYCYTTGDSVRGNNYWAKVAVGPDRYVPATYLLYGNSGPSAGVSFCAPASSSGSPGVDYDFVAYSGGEGVRYRYSPRLNDLVPGNGPFEGDRVTIYCYTTGDSVRGNNYWAKVAVGPDRYVPATYLRYGYSGPPGGVPFC